MVKINHKYQPFIFTAKKEELALVDAIIITRYLHLLIYFLRSHINLYTLQILPVNCICFLVNIKCGYVINSEQIVFSNVKISIEEHNLKVNGGIKYFTSGKK